MYATIIVNTRQGGIGNGLTYRVPDPASSGRILGGQVLVGSLVKVPLRKKLIEGIVIATHEQKPDGDYDVKEIASVISDDPLLAADQIGTAQWIADYYMCPLRSAVGLWLPGSSWEKLLPEKEEWIRYTIQLNSIMPEKRGKRQQILIDYLKGKDWVRWKEAKESTGTDKGVLRRLIEQKLVETKSESRGEMARYAPPQHDIRLTPRQAAACKAIQSDPRPTLLFGVTGSGKTEIYAALIRDAVERGESSILLLPEILLTENFVGKFQQLIDRDSIAVIHSRLTPAERRRMWQRCREGSIQLVIGSRSALFSPLLHPGLIIIDEEHEWTYKNEQSPRYHAVKVAEHMCAGAKNSMPLQRPKLLLGTATPSVESWFKATSGTYQLVELPERFGGALLPSVQIVDLGQVQFDRYYPLSPTLINGIRARLDRREQAILFLNRRGFATSLLCMDCRYRFEDPSTHLPYTVHFRGARPYLLSHHTGEMMDVPAECPKCRSANLRQVGAGTQRIESILRELFPSARILRADADTLTSPEKMRTLLEAMKTGQADILLGTQSVVKGLDLPGVTLAAVLLADVGLSLPHFRAGERVFQLLTQLTGRSGRKIPGEVIIQTFRPKAIEVELAAAHNVRAYLERELIERERAHYPPDTDMVRFVFTQENAEKQSREFVEELKRRSQRLEIVHQISRAPSLFGGGRVWHVFLRGKNIRGMLMQLPNFPMTVDIDPIECL